MRRKANQHMYFGDFAERIDALLEGFRELTKTHESVSSIADMQRFVTSFPEYQDQKRMVEKHGALTHELSRIVAGKQLMDVSKCEQVCIRPPFATLVGLACADGAFWL